MSQQREWSSERLERIRSLIRDLYAVVAKLNEEFEAEGRKFPPDGHMLGSIGEILAAYAFDLELLLPSTSVHDAKSEDGRLVQIKLTGGRSIALNSRPNHLIVLQLMNERVKLIYNGPGEVVWESCGPRQKNGQRSIRLSKLERLNAVATSAIPQVRPFPL